MEAWGKDKGLVPLHRIVAELRRAPARLRVMVRRAITQAYGSASKSWGHEPPGYQGPFLEPRRALDMLWRHLALPAERLSAAKAEGRDVARVYDWYLRRTSQRLHPDQPPYGLSEVLGVAQAIQDVMKSHGPVKEIVIGGSFPNGRAKLDRSDLDVVDPQARIPEPVLAAITKKVRGSLAGYAGIQSVDLRAEPAWGLDQRFVADMSPLFLRISKSRVVLVAYPALGRPEEFPLR